MAPSQREKTTNPHTKSAIGTALVAVPGKLSAELADRAFKDLVAALENRIDPITKSTVGNALDSDGKRLDVPLKLLVDALAGPLCTEVARETVLAILEARSGQTFHGDPFVAARWARENGLAVSLRPE